ncbi:MAG: zinc finger domain-containing protein [Methanobacteriota archaeon]
MKKAETCITCGKGLLTQGSTTFPCPHCEAVIGRCNGCREQSIHFTCLKCGFIGP